MNVVDIIIKKRDGFALTKAEINFFIQGYSDGTIPDYQASAWAMAVLLRGMNESETADLTMAMAHSGDFINLENVVDLAVDKHSTGGIGDKTTLIVQPIITACGLKAAKMSGRGLGFTGGTIDKLESIPGMRLDLSKEEFLTQLREHGSVISGQSASLAPADGKLYALRDVTGTVPAPALIASSIMSKKLAAGAQVILLDVKVGVGAFMATLEEAQDLAKRMVSIGKACGKIIKAEISDMNQPLGVAVGNILEVKEAVDFLRGKPTAPDLAEHCLESSALLLVMANVAQNMQEARLKAQEAVKSGAAFEKLLQLIALQGGDSSYLEDLSKFPEAPHIQVVQSPQDGFISEIHARIVGETSVHLGAGRMKKGDPIDNRVGILVHKKVGDAIQAGEALFTIHACNGETASTAHASLLNAVKFSATPCHSLPPFYGLVE